MNPGDAPSRGDQTHASIRKYDARDEMVISIVLTEFHKGEIEAKYSEEHIIVKAGQDALGQYAYTRKFDVPEEANTDGVEAQFNNGVLILTIPLTGA